MGGESGEQMKTGNCDIADQWAGQGVEGGPVAWSEGSEVGGLREEFRNKGTL